jgi:hypothetical protein
MNITAACLYMANVNYELLIADEKIKTIVFSMTWYDDHFVDAQDRPLAGDPKMNLLHAVERLVAAVRERGKNVYLVGPIQIPETDLPSSLSRQVKFNHLSSAALAQHLRTPRTAFDADFAPIIATLKTQLGARFILPSEALCDAAFCYFGDAGGLFFSDSNHLGTYGVSKVATRFEVIQFNSVTK